MNNEILSPQNSRVKEWTHLLERRGRDKQGKFLIEGFHLVEEAVKAEAAVTTIVYSLEKGKPAALYAATEDRIEWIGVSQAVLEKCSDTQTPQGIFAVVSKPDMAGGALWPADMPDLVVVIDGIQDPGNLGTIIRSADAVGAGGILLGAGTVDAYNPKAIRSTMGSFFHLPIVEGDLLQILPHAKAEGVQLVTTSLQASQSCYETDLSKPTWIILGNEAKGVSPEVGDIADVKVIIPMQGKAESLNVAMAATVLLFEASRQRRYQPKINTYQSK
jgi:TrmH family RNA methyltransferase